jgi:DNA-binding PadR family transcriptional regulator
LKREPNFDEHWLAQEMERDGLANPRIDRQGSKKYIALTDQGRELRLRYLVITHKRNGEHIVLQNELPQ